MTQFINIADLQDPNDPEGRSYREVNRARKHKHKVGQLVELDNRCRLYIAKLTRDCDETPLYSLAVDIDDHDSYWLHGYSEESLKAV